MMIGEIDYGSIVVEAKDQHNEETGAPLAPIPEFSAVIICLFCVMVSVILMNLLVSVRYLSNRPQVSMGYKLLNHVGCW